MELNPDMTIVVGQATYGKTVWTKLFTRGLPRAFFYDPTATYDVDRWVTLDELIDMEESGFFKTAKHFRIGLYDPEGVEYIGNLAYKYGHCGLILEEASTIFTRNQILPSWMRRHTFLGRHRLALLIVTAQRAATIPIDIRTQARRIVSFMQLEKADLDWLRPRFRDWTDSAPELEVLECMEYHRRALSKYSIAKALHLLPPEGQTTGSTDPVYAGESGILENDDIDENSQSEGLTS